MEASGTRPVTGDRLLALASLTLSSRNLQHSLDEVARVTTELLPATFGASVILWDASAETYTLASSTVPGQEPGLPAQAVRTRNGATRWIIDRGEPLVVSDTSTHPLGNGKLIRDFNVPSFVGVPIQREQEMLGVLYGLDSETRHYTDDDIAFLRILADRAARAITDARVVDALRDDAESHRDQVFRAREQRRRADAVARVANALLDVVTPDSDLRVVVNGITQALDAERAYLAVMDPRTESLVMSYGGGFDVNAMEQITYEELMAGLTGWAVRNDRTAVSETVDDREADSVRKKRSMDRTGPIIVAPLHLGDGYTGTLTVTRRVGRPMFNASDVSTVEVMASQASLALERHRLLEANKRLAHADALTDLPNRRYLEIVGSELIEGAIRYGHDLAVIVIDADEFKEVNDLHGHRAGDETLIAIADACRSAARSADVVGRWGGDEFVAILPETDAAGAKLVAERIATHNEGNRVTLSMGVAARARDELTLEALMHRADRAMYDSKASGRGTIHVA